MSEFDEKYNKIIEDISKNIKDEKELQFVKEKMNELSAIFINMFNQVNNSSEKRITDLEKNQKGLEEKINKVEKFIEDMKKDIYDEYDEEDYEFEIICPYCNHIFTFIFSFINFKASPNCSLFKGICSYVSLSIK